VLATADPDSTASDVIAYCPASAPYLISGSGYGVDDSGNFAPLVGSPNFQGSENGLVSSDASIGWSVSRPTGDFVAAEAICAH
jgi:hypothetical protein